MKPTNPIFDRALWIFLALLALWFLAMWITTSYGAPIVSRNLLWTHGTNQQAVSYEQATNILKAEQSTGLIIPAIAPLPRTNYLQIGDQYYNWSDELMLANGQWLVSFQDNFVNGHYYVRCGRHSGSYTVTNDIGTNFGFHFPLPIAPYVWTLTLGTNVVFNGSNNPPTVEFWRAYVLTDNRIVLYSTYNFPDWSNVVGIFQPSDGTGLKWSKHQ